MSSIKGGRGHKAPWKSVTARCPEPILPEIQAYVEDWRRSTLDEEYGREYQIISWEKLEPIIKRILRRKQSARNSFDALIKELGLHPPLEKNPATESDSGEHNQVSL